MDPFFPALGSRVLQLFQSKGQGIPKTHGLWTVMLGVAGPWSGIWVPWDWVRLKLLAELSQGCCSVNYLPWTQHHTAWEVLIPPWWYLLPCDVRVEKWPGFLGANVEVKLYMVCWLSPFLKRLLLNISRCHIFLRETTPAGRLLLCPAPSER